MRMRAPSNLQLAGIFFVIAIALMVLIATRKTTVTTAAPTSYTNDTVAKYIDEAKKQNELERDQREQADKLAKLAKAKKESVECQFWLHQKQSKSTNPRLDDKITQFCELPLEQAPSSAAAP